MHAIHSFTQNIIFIKSEKSIHLMNLNKSQNDPTLGFRLSFQFYNNIDYFQLDLDNFIVIFR